MVNGKAGRLWRNLMVMPWRLRRAFPLPTRQAISAEIAASERRHGGQVVFAVEGGMSVAALLDGQTPRERALEVFSLLRVWDTENNNGVLVYLLLAERDVEIVADRGIDAQVDDQEWQAICHGMEAAFRDGQYDTGSLEGIRAVSWLLERNFPPQLGATNELPDQPVLL